MFLNPVKNPPEEQRLPVLTGGLVLLLIALWGLCSMLDKGALDKAHDYYQSSVLAALEVPLYNQQNTQATLSANQLSKSEWLTIQTDAEFVTALERNKLITPSNRQYPEWKDARERHSQLLAKAIGWEYGFISSRPSAVSSLSHMFIHPGLLLLLVNIVFLLLFGSMLEGILGRSVTAMFIVLSAVSSSWLVASIMGSSLLPYTGISALLACFAAFITSCYRSNTLKTQIPGLPALPAYLYAVLWLVVTIAAFFLTPFFNGNPLFLVAPIAIGAVAGLLARSRLVEDEPEDITEDLSEEEADDLLQQQLSEVASMCDEGKYADALPILQKLEKQHPREHEIAYRLQQCARRDSNSEEYHQYSLKVLRYQARDERVHEMVRETFMHYITNARPSRLNKATIVSLAERFLRVGNLVEAEYLVKVLLKKPPITDEVGQLIEKLSNLLAADGQDKKARVYRMGLAKVMSDNAPVDTMILDAYR